MSRVHQLKISVSGIRGVVGEFLTPNLAWPLARRLEPMWAQDVWCWAAIRALPARCWSMP